MGRWMEVLRQQPPQGQRDHDQVYAELVVREIGPHPLMYAFGALCQANPGDELEMEAKFDEHLYTSGYRKFRVSA